MNAVRAMGIFCEDIREEAQGMHSIVGIFPDNLNVPHVPGAVPKIGFYVRITVPGSAEVEEASVAILFPDGEERTLLSLEKELLAKAAQEARDTDMPFGTVVAKAIASPFPFPSVGRFKLVLRVDGAELVCATLNVQQTPALTSASPSEPPQPEPQSPVAGKSKAKKRAPSRPSRRRASPKRRP
jgi:hypothetical protein